MSKERLLKRIRYWGRGQGDRVSRLEAGEYRQSVLADISSLYNTQQGTVLIADDMGVPDFASLLNRFGPKEVDVITQSLREVTEKYEPRMRNVRVSFLPRDDEHEVLRFSVSGSLEFQGQDIPIEFSALIQGNGTVSIDN